MGTIKDVLQHPSARLTQHLRLSIGTVDSPLDVLEFRLAQAFNQTYIADITLTSTDKAIDGAACVGRRATFMVEEKAAVPSVPGLVTPVVEPALLVHGVVTQWERVKANRDEATYRMLIEPRVALLDRVHDSAVFHNKTLKDLITDLVVDRKLFDSFDIEFALEDAQEQFEQTVMYEETVWNFISRHCRRAGYFWYFKQGNKADGPRRDTIVFGNNPRAYVRALEVPLMPDSGLSANWHEAVLTISEVRKLVPAGVEIWEHNYRTPADPLKADSTVAHDDRSLYGSVNRSTEHHHHAEAGQMLACVRREELVARQTTFKGTSNVLGMMPGMVVRLTNHTLSGAEYGVVITRLVTTGSRTKPVTNEFEATPSHLTWRPEYIPEKHWRWISGTLPGIVGSVDDQPYASLDEYGRYAVIPHFLRSSGIRGTNLLSLRLLRPSASYQGGFHSPLLPQTEVRLSATNGDIDRLHIAGALHDYAHPDIVHGKAGWYSRAIWRAPLGGADIRFEDMRGRQGAKMATVHMKSSVSLGYLVDSQKRRRGEGFEAWTLGHAVVRGVSGIFLSADKQEDPNKPHLEMQAAMAQLQSALAETAALRADAQRANAELAQIKAHQAQLENAFKDVQKAVILLSAPDGIGAVTPKSIQLAGGEHVGVAAGANADLSVGDHLARQRLDFPLRPEQRHQGARSQRQDRYSGAVGRVTDVRRTEP